MICDDFEFFSMAFGELDTMFEWLFPMTMTMTIYRMVLVFFVGCFFKFTNNIVAQRFSMLNDMTTIAFCQTYVSPPALSANTSWLGPLL